MPTVSELREQYPNSFGWRMWKGAESGLLRPFRGVDHAAESAACRAHCPHGNVAPAAECVCGIHYVTRTENFAVAVEYLNIPANAWPVPMSAQALTFGAAIGPTLPDFSDDENWLEVPRRCAEYRILGILLPAPARPIWQQLAEPESGSARNRLVERYGVPVVAGRIKIDTYGHLIASARQLERVLDEQAPTIPVDALRSDGPAAAVDPYVAELCGS